MEKKKFIISLNNALRGVKLFFTSELHAVYHSIAALLVIVAGIVFGVNPMEWVLLVIAIALVFVSEFVNTIIERIIDIFYPEKHAKVGKIKDMAAGMVLFSSLIAVILGVIVFYPYIIAFIK